MGHRSAYDQQYGIGGSAAEAPVRPAPDDPGHDPGRRCLGLCHRRCGDSDREEARGKAVPLQRVYGPPLPESLLYQFRRHRDDAADGRQYAADGGAPVSVYQPAPAKAGAD